MKVIKMASINVTVHKIDDLFTGGCQKGVDCSKVKSIGIKKIQLPHQPISPDCALGCNIVPVQEGVLFTFFNVLAFFNGVNHEFVLFDLPLYNQVKNWLQLGNIVVVGGPTIDNEIEIGNIPLMIITPNGVVGFNDLNQSIIFSDGIGYIQTCDGITYTTQYPYFIPGGYVYGFIKEQEVDNTITEVQVEVIEYNGQTWYIGYNGTSIIKQCVNNAFANNRTIQDFTFDCNTGDIAITFINGTSITRNLKCLLPEIVDIVNIGAGNPNPTQINPIQVKNTGEVFFVDKDGDVQQIEFLQPDIPILIPTPQIDLSAAYQQPFYKKQDVHSLKTMNVPPNELPVNLYYFGSDMKFLQHNPVFELGYYQAGKGHKRKDGRRISKPSHLNGLGQGGFNTHGGLQNNESGSLLLPPQTFEVPFSNGVNTIPYKKTQFVINVKSFYGAFHIKFNNTLPDLPFITDNFLYNGRGDINVNRVYVLYFRIRINNPKPILHQVSGKPINRYLFSDWSEPILLSPKTQKILLAENEGILTRVNIGWRLHKSRGELV